MKDSSWKVTPIGGVGEIGSNMALISLDKIQIIVDIGILFPYEDFFDINYLIPDFSLVDPNKKTILMITHGHEDHIGAIHHLMSHLQDFQVYAPRFAKELIHQKLSKNNLGCRIELYDATSELRFDFLTIKPIQVNHSIPDTYGLIIHDRKNALIYISDFKVDPHAILEPAIDFAFLAKYLEPFEQRITLLDSTNILQTGKTPSETELIPALEELISGPKRVFFTLFASNIHRLKNIITLACKYNKKVVISGRSLWFYLEAAKNCDLISDEEYSILVDYNSGLPANYIVLLTGCQGEHFGSLRRVAMGDHPALKLCDSDIVAFSSKNIPGNEKKINRIINKITEAGAEVITAYDKLIHASGHPAQEDLKLIIPHLKPTHYIPIHGETYFLKKHIEFIKKINPQIKTNFLLNGDSISIKEEVEFIKGEVLPPNLIHGKNLTIERERISERRKLACNGAVFISVLPNKKNVAITVKGLPVIVDSLIDDLESLTMTFLNKSKKSDLEEQSENIRIAVRNFLNQTLGYKPITIVHVV